MCLANLLFHTLSVSDKNIGFARNLLLSQIELYFPFRIAKQIQIIDLKDLKACKIYYFVLYRSESNYRVNCESAANSVPHKYMYNLGTKYIPVSDNKY